MIYDTVKNSVLYDGVSFHVATALRYLRETDFAALPDGQYDIDGENVFANLMTYTTKETNDTPEGHKDYIDLQYLISGHEQIGVGRLDQMTECVEAHPERDIWLYHGATEPLTLGDGLFMLLWPDDVHAPAIAPTVPGAARKCIIKIRV
ncbi:MAG: YhcH/YjgK/YiaL family protein [Pygmaiobacter sp.]